MYCKPISLTVLIVSFSFDRQKLDIAGCPWPVLLCTYFCEKQQSTVDQSLEVLHQSVRGNADRILLKVFVNLTVEQQSVEFMA